MTCLVYKDRGTGTRKLINCKRMKQDHRQMVSLSKGIVINFSDKPKAKIPKPETNVFLIRKK